MGDGVNEDAAKKSDVTIFPTCLSEIPIIPASKSNTSTTLLELRKYLCTLRYLCS